MEELDGKYIEKLSRKSREYILNLFNDSKYVDKFMRASFEKVASDEFILCELTSDELLMQLFVIEWSLSLRIVGTQERISDQRRFAHIYIHTDRDQRNHDDLLNERSSRLYELRNDDNLTLKYINFLIQNRFSEQIKFLEENCGLIKIPYIPTDYGGIAGYVYDVKAGNKLIVKNRYPMGGD